MNRRFQLITRPADPIAETLASVRGVQKVEDANLPALQEILNRQSWVDPYAGSAAYHGMTGRRGLWIAAQDGAFMLIAKHPAKPDKLLLYPPVGEHWHRIAGLVLRDVAALPGGFQFARVPYSEVKYAMVFAAGVAPRTEQTQAHEDALDWRYPVHVLDTAAVAAHSGSAFRDFRKNVGRVDAARVRIEPLYPERHRGAVQAIARAWVTTKGEHDPAALDALLEPYRRLLDLMADLPIKGRLYCLDGRPAGFAIWEETDRARGIANSLADLTDRQTKGMSEFVYADMCNAIRQSGFDAVCIGGSEERGLDAFKRKMQPVRSVQLTSLHYRPTPTPRSFPVLHVS